jgi:hypothetical protein
MSKPTGNTGSFDLHVTFSGLTLLVPVGQNELWAMMVRHPSGNAADDHHLYVTWPPPFKETDAFQHAVADGQRITFTGAATTKDVRTLLEVVKGNLTKKHGVKAPKKSSTKTWFDPKKPLHPKLGGWVRLVNVASITPAGGRYWRYGDEQRVLLSTHVTAVVPGTPGNSIAVPLADGTSLTLNATGGVLKVGFFNVPRSEITNPSMGQEPLDGQEPPHFHAIANLLGIPHGHAPKYIWPQNASTGGAAQAGVRMAPESATATAPAPAAGSTMTAEMVMGVNPYACLSLPLCPDDDPACG